MWYPYMHAGKIHILENIINFENKKKITNKLNDAHQSIGQTKQNNIQKIEDLKK